MDVHNSECEVATFQIGPATSTTRSWDIKVTQYSCGDEDNAGEHKHILTQTVRKNLRHAFHSQVPLAAFNTSLALQVLWQVMLSHLRLQPSHQRWLIWRTKTMRIASVGKVDTVTSAITLTQLLEQVLRPLRIHLDFRKKNQARSMLIGIDAL